MSQTTKRNAHEAFGKDGKHARDLTATKKSRRKSAKDSSQHIADAMLLPPSTETPREKVSQNGTRGLTSSLSAKSDMESGKSEEKSRKDNSTVKIASRDSTSDNINASSQKSKARSKRKSKPQFDQNNSQIELLLSKVDQLSDGSAMEEVSKSVVQQKTSPKHKDKSRREEKAKSHKHNSKRDRSLAHPTKDSPAWSLSRPLGGAFIDHDPVLTPDEQFLILATKRDVRIYATKTSLLVRTLHVAKESNIVTYAQIPAREQYVVVGLNDGTLLKYDWTTGSKLWSIGFNGSITSITSTSSSATGDGFLMINESEDGSYNMTSLVLDEKGRLLGRRHLLSQKTLIKPQICFSAALGVVAVCSKDTIFIGKLGDEGGDDRAPLHWHEISVVGKIVCFDAQILSAASKPKKGLDQPIVNVAVGLKSGEIQLYNDVLNNVTHSHDNELHIRRLHWHRAAPRAVKFSPDSNYLISGGDETVLVIWQLDTNQKQVLPHLTTAILNIIVSKQGSAYGLRLGDNSVMVLSTADLQPFANVSSIAFDASSKAQFLPSLSIPAVLHPNNPDQLLLAYSLQSLNPSMKPSEKSSNMLQTFDIASQLQLNRQALARSLVSTVNVGPNGQQLNEPDVTHMDISHDGRWLVTVDQWSPNDVDLKEMYLTRGDQSSRGQLNECILRFWTTSTSPGASSTDSWEMNTRIDEPVSAYGSAHKRAILAIAGSPIRHQIAVADTNRHLKIYSPKARTRSGVSVKDTNGQPLFTWTCDHELSFEEASQAPDPRSATLAFSEDGSILAVSWTTNNYLKARVHLVEPKTGRTAASLPNIVTHGYAQLAFCGQYLVGLSEKFCIYDTITLQQTVAIDIDDKFNHGKARLAVNTRSGIVAVAVSEREVKAASQLMLLDVHASDRRPLLEEQIPDQVHILLAEKDRGGFLVIDGEGRTMKLSPPGSVSTALVANEDIPEKAIVRGSLGNVFGTGRKDAVDTIRQEVGGPQRMSLEDVLSFSSSAQAPAARDLFNQVALVVSGAAA